jgi:hypothetical protein
MAAISARVALKKNDGLTTINRYDALPSTSFDDLCHYCGSMSVGPHRIQVAFHVGILVIGPWSIEITFPSTNKSAQNPASNLCPSNSIEMGTWGSTDNPGFRSLAAEVTSYSVSSNPGPRSWCKWTAMSTINVPISFSCISVTL